MGPDFDSFIESFQYNCNEKILYVTLQGKDVINKVQFKNVELKTLLKFLSAKDRNKFVFKYMDDWRCIY